MIWIQLDVSVVRDAAGAPAYFIGQIQDITNRRQLEEQFRQSQKMEAVGRLAGGVAHDFNNLLTVISGYSELALQRVTDGESRPDADDVREDLEEIKNAAARAASLTQQLLAFSRQQVVQPGKLDLNEIVAEIEKMLDRLIGEDVELVVHLDATAGPVEADAGQLEQVIMNLAVNARDAMPDGGTLTIETTAIELEVALDSEHGRVEPGRYVRLAVTDDGAGMDAETQARIFEPFFTTKELGKGTGLGLSTVYGILEQSGGHVRIHTSPGNGTCVRDLSAGVHERADAADAAPAGAGPVGGSETILLVEDETSVRDLTRRMLEESGYRVLSAASGRRCPAALHDEPRAHRSACHGRRHASDARRRGRAARRPHPAQACASSSCPATPTTRSTSDLAGSISFLQKPFTLVELLGAVRSALQC